MAGHNPRRPPCTAHVTSGRTDGTFTYDAAGAASQAAETAGLHDIVVCRRLRGGGFPVIGSSTTGSEGAEAGGEALLTTGETLTVTLCRQTGADSPGGGGSHVIDPIVPEWAVASGGNAAAPLDGARPLLALRSLIDDSLRKVSRRGHRPACGLTGRPG